MRLERLEGPGEPSFTQIHDTFQARRMEERGQLVSGLVSAEVAKGGDWWLNTRGPSTSNGDKDLLLENRLKEGAQLVFQGMANEYGPGMAQRVLWKVGERAYGKQNRTFENGMTRGDLSLLHKELQCQEAQVQRLRDRVPNDTTEMIKDDLVGNWTSAAREQFYPIQGFGNAQAGPRSMEEAKEGYYPIEGLHDADAGLRPLRYGLKEGPGDTEVVGTRPLYEVKEEYPSIQWPSPCGTIGLREVVQDQLQCNIIWFYESTGTLTVTHCARHDCPADKRDLTKFVETHFNVKPGHPAFQNILNNILSYLPRGAAASMTDKMLNAAAGSAAADGGSFRSKFTLSVRDGNVGVKGYATMRYTNPDPDPGAVDFRWYRFVREEGFEISGELLRVDPTVFDPKANLVSVDRFDAVNVATWGLDTPHLAAYRADPSRRRTT
jgi:hypothetical protein